MLDILLRERVRLLSKQLSHQGRDINRRGIGQGLTTRFSETRRRKISEANCLNHKDSAQPIRDLPTLARNCRKPGERLSAPCDTDIRMMFLIKCLIRNKWISIRLR